MSSASHPAGHGHLSCGLNRLCLVVVLLLLSLFRLCHYCMTRASLSPRSRSTHSSIVSGGSPRNETVGWMDDGDAKSKLATRNDMGLAN
jgi:hypothetical protein